MVGEVSDDVIRPVFGSQMTVAHSGHCQHRQMVVDESKRTIECQSCGAVLDPFDVHMQYARRERSWRYWDRERKQAEARVEELKAEEKRIKARMANASRKDADTAVQAERERWREKRQKLAWKAKEIEREAGELKRALGMKDEADGKVG